MLYGRHNTVVRYCGTDLIACFWCYSVSATLLPTKHSCCWSASAVAAIPMRQRPVGKRRKAAATIHWTPQADTSTHCATAESHAALGAKQCIQHAVCRVTGWRHRWH